LTFTVGATVDVTVGYCISGGAATVPPERKGSQIMFTNSQFKALPRNTDGDIIDLEAAYPFITVAQRERLTGDDYSRMDDLDEEMRYLIAEFE